MIVLEDMAKPQQQPSLDEEGRYSFGTTAPIDRLLELFRQDKMGSGVQDAEEIILINLSTLVRNRLHKDTSFHQIAKAIEADVSGIIREFSEQLSQGTLNKALIFYTMQYERQLPPDLQRKDSQQRAKIRTGTTLLRAVLPQHRQQLGKLQVAVVHSDSILPSYLAIRGSLAKFPVARPKVRMISHVPIDYHVYQWYEGDIIKSFTGDLLKADRNTIGNYVFKHPQVPFTVATHLLFGDSEVVKGTLSPKDKKRVLEVAEQERWTMHTPMYINDALQRLNIEVPNNLK